MDANAEKKIALVNVLSFLIIFYSFQFPLLSYLEIIPQNLLQSTLLVVLGIVGVICSLCLKKYPQKYKTILIFLLTSFYFIATVALINVANDNFRAVWFFFIVLIAFLIAGKRVGFLFSIAIVIIFFAYFFSPLNNIDTVTFITIFISLLIMIHLSFHFAAIMDANEQKLINYQQNLESMVEEKVTEINQLNEEIINTQQEVIYTMGAIGETRSKETGQHVKRVAIYSYMLAKLSGLSEEDAATLKLASPMHDIGKIGIEDAILNKPGRLTAEEIIIMQTHVNIGYEMLKCSQRTIFKTAAIVALRHHEKYDGTGYPNGLKGEDIHIYGRITALADVFDALGSVRIYKKAWQDEEIFAYLRKQSGQHFDPKLIEIFFANLDQFLAVRNEFKD